MRKFKTSAKSFIALIMTLAMLLGICLPVGALGVSANDAVQTDKLAYSVAYEDGKIVVKINPETVYRILKDKHISKAELASLIPEGILDAAAKGRDLTVDDLKELAAQFVTLDELKAIVNDIPADVLKEYVDVDFLKALFDAEEIINLLPIDEMLEVATGDALNKLLTDEVTELLFKQELIDKVVTDEFVEDLLEGSDLVDRITTDETIKSKLIALVDDKLAQKMLDHPEVGPRLEEYVGELVFNDDDLLKTIFDHILDFETDPAKQTEADKKKHDNLTSFMTNSTIEDKFLTKDNLLNKDVIADLIAAKVVDRAVITAAFTPAELRTLITDDMLSDILSNKSFIQKVIQGSTIADKVLTTDLVKELAKIDEIKSAMENKASGMFTYDEVKNWNIIDEDKVVDAYVARGTFNVADMEAKGIYTITGGVFDLNYIINAVDPSKKTDVIYIAANLSGVDPADGLDANEFVALVQKLYEENILSLSTFVDLEGITINADPIADELIAAGYTADDFIKDGVDYVDIILKDKDAANTITDAVKNDDAMIALVADKGNSIIKTRVETLLDAGTIKMNDVIALMDDTTLNGIIAKIDPQSVVNLINADPDPDAKFEDLFDAFGDDHQKIVDAISHDTMLNVLEDNKAIFHEHDVIDLFVDTFDPLGDDALMEKLSGLDAIISEKADFNYLVNTVVGVKNLTVFFSVDALIDAVGINTILEYVDIAEVINQIGAQELISMYSTDEIRAIIEAIGTDNIKAFIQESGVLDAINVREIARNVIDLAKSKVPLVKTFIKETVSKTLNIFLTRVDTISYNGIAFYSGAKFDVNALLFAVINSIPDIENFLAIEENGTWIASVLSLGITHGDEIKTYEYGFEVKFEGDPEKFQQLVERSGFYEALSMSPDHDYVVALSVPEVFSDIYGRLLQSSRIPQSVKNQLVRLPEREVGEAADILKSVLEDEQVFTVINEKLDAIKAKAYAKIDARFEDVEIIDRAKAKVDDILDSFVTRENYNKAASKIISVVERTAATLGRENSIWSQYVSNGVFTFNRSFSFDFISAIERFISLPDEVRVIFKSTVISGNVTGLLGVDGLYGITAIDKYGNPFSTLLPNEVDLSVLSNVLGTGFMDENAQKIDKMPSADVTVYTDDSYYVQFIIGEQVVATEFYPIGAQSVTEPDLETLDWAGKDTYKYVYAWEPYELNVQQVTKVHLTQTDNVISVTFVDEAGETIGRQAFPYGTAAADVMAWATENLARRGYTLSDLVGYDALGEREQTVTVKYTGNVYTVTWYADADKREVVSTASWTFGDATTYPKANPTAPTKAGYEFAGWSTDVSAIDFNTPENLDIWATWKAVDTPPAEKEMVVVTFVDADTGALLGVMEFELGTAADVVAAYAQTTFARPGYSLAISGYAADGAKAQTVTVKYSVITYTATFIADGVVVGTVPFTVESTVPLEGEPEVPQKEGYTGTWKEYTIKAEDMEIHAIYSAIEEEEGSLLWILWIILALIVVVAIIIIIIIKRKGSTPPPAAPIAPIVEPEIEAEPEIEPEVEPVVAPVEEVIEHVEDVTVEEADELMTDDVAIHLVATKKAAAVVGAKAIVNISSINDAFADGDTVTVEALKEKRLIPNNTGKVKILAGGHLNKALTVEAHAFSVQAIKMITLTGGSVTQIVTK